MASGVAATPVFSSGVDFFTRYEPQPLQLYMETAPRYWLGTYMTHLAARYLFVNTTFERHCYHFMRFLYLLLRRPVGPAQAANWVHHEPTSCPTGPSLPCLISYPNICYVGSILLLRGTHVFMNIQRKSNQFSWFPKGPHKKGKYCTQYFVVVPRNYIKYINVKPRKIQLGWLTVKVKQHLDFVFHISNLHRFSHTMGAIEKFLPSIFFIQWQWRGQGGPAGALSPLRYFI